MTATLLAATGIAIAYLIGAFPSAYLAGKSKGIDLRQYGSGNLGATNAVRVLGTKIGGLVFAADILKGMIPVVCIPRFISVPDNHWFAILLGLAAIAGHVRSIFLIGKGGGGGKGVATAAGVFLGLAWLPTLIAFCAWLIVFGIWRYVSLASLVAAAALPVAFVLTGWSLKTPTFIVAIGIAVFVFYTHRANIGRLRRGEEHHFRKKTKADVDVTPTQGGLSL